VRHIAAGRTSKEIAALLYLSQKTVESHRTNMFTRLKVHSAAEPVDLSFVGASLTSPGTMEAYEHNLPKDSPLRALFLADKEAGEKPDWTFNMLLKHGVRSCLEYAKNFDLKRARSLSNLDLAPHLEFVDLGGHGYAKVRLSADAMRTEFVCIPRPHCA
jgi:alkaline phosphatase D